MPAAGREPRPLLLLVEDDPLLREALADYGTDLGFQVHAAADGIEAMELIVSDDLRPVVIVLDLIMPSMDGWQLLAALERCDPLRPIPCIVITGVKQHGLEHRHSTAVLPKPFALCDLTRELQRHQLAH